ncbi:MAG: hypothetical protein HYT71_01860 [Candidatus Aenigmarchaeota archaeon]|nr:hypothetical protein [Candidatus Aenigmarchaeota archaeon]
MAIGVLEKLERELGTETSPERRTVTQRSETAGGLQFNSITIIENPFQGGVIGFILSEGYQRKPGIGEVELSRVGHYRGFVLSGNSLQVPRHYDSATIMKGFDEFPYSLIRADKRVLYRPSKTNYEVCFVPSEDFIGVKTLLGAPNSFRDGLETVYRMVSANSKSGMFSLEDGKLKMPKDYAAMGMPGEFTKYSKRT